MAYGVILGQTPKAEEKDTFKSPLIIEDASSPTLTFKNTTNNQSSSLQFNSNRLQISSKVNLNGGGTVNTPSSSTDIANKQYVDNAVSNISNTSVNLSYYTVTSSTTTLDIGPLDSPPVFCYAMFGVDGGVWWNESIDTTVCFGYFTGGKTIGSEWNLQIQGVRSDGKSFDSFGEIGTLILKSGKYYISCSKDTWMGTDLFPGLYGKFLVLSFY